MPASFSRSIPRPSTFGNGSRIAMTTRFKPAWMTASVQGSFAVMGNGRA